MSLSLEKQLSKMKIVNIFLNLIFDILNLFIFQWISISTSERGWKVACIGILLENKTDTELRNSALKEVNSELRSPKRSSSHFLIFFFFYEFQCCFYIGICRFTLI